MRTDIGTTGPSFRSTNVSGYNAYNKAVPETKANVAVKGNINSDENIDKKFDLACRVAAYYKSLYESSVLNKVDCKGCVIPQYYAFTPCTTPVAFYNV